MARRQRRLSPSGLLDEATTTRWRPWRAGLVLFATVIVAPTVGLLAVNQIVHRDLEHSARAASSAMAGQLASNLGLAMGDRARLTAGAVELPSLAGAAQSANRAEIVQSLSLLVADGGFCSAQLIVSPSLTVSASDPARCPGSGGTPPRGLAGAEILPSGATGRAALITNRSTFTLATGTPVTLLTTYDLAGVIAPLQAPNGGDTSLLTDGGLIVQSSTPSQIGMQAKAPPFLAMVRSHHAGSAQIWAPSVHESLLFSYQPIAGATYGIVSSVPTSVAYAGANRLQRELWAGYAAFVLLAAAVAGATSLKVHRHDRARAGASRRAAALAEASPDGIAVLDPDRTVVYANRSLATMLGHEDPTEMLGRSASTWAGPDDYEPRRDDPASRIGKIVSLHRIDGSPVPIEANAAPFDLSGRSGKLVVIRDITERRRVERAIAAGESRQRAILDTIPDGVVLYALSDDRVPYPVMTNPAATEMLGLDLDPLGAGRGKESFEAIDEHGAPIPHGHMPVARVAGSGKPLDGLVWGARRGGATRWVRSSTRPITDDHGEVTGVVTCLVDISQERAVHRELAAAHARYATLVEHGSDLISVIDSVGNLQYVSPAYERLFGWTTSQIGRPADQCLHPDDQRLSRRRMAQLISTPDQMVTFRCRLRTVWGEYRHLDVTCSNRLADPWINGFVANSRDVTEEVEASELLRHQATHDPLTGLANRTLLLDRLDQALQDGACAVLFMDLDHFKRVNDTLGHAAGDDLLEVIARRLEATLRPGDSVARVGGDEFVVVAVGVSSPSAASAVAARVRDAITKPVRLSARTVTVGCSVGIAIPTRDSEPEVLLQEADTALYQAKERGRNRSEIYDTAMRVRTQQRLDAEALVRTAVEEDHLAVLFQPVVDLSTGLPVGTEALARLAASDGTLIGPDEFIGAAEESGLIIPLGAVILDMACAQQGRWHAARSPFTRMSVNLSAQQLSEPGLVEGITRTLHRYGLAPAHLCLELTESSLIDAADTTRRAISDLQHMGITLALDDFGTGWSSLAYLRRFPIDIIKIDRSFVAGLGTDRNDTEVVRAVIGLGRALGLTTVAEGVETPSQAQQLILLGCRFAQGYFYGRPATADDLDHAWHEDRADRRIVDPTSGRHLRADVPAIGASWP